MLSVGQRFKSFNQLYRVVQQHEEECNGAFELTKEKLHNGFTKVHCKCSGPLDNATTSCPAYLVAEERSANDVVILETFLQHGHAWTSNSSNDDILVDDNNVGAERRLTPQYTTPTYPTVDDDVTDVGAVPRVSACTPPPVLQPIITEFNSTTQHQQRHRAFVDDAEDDVVELLDRSEMISISKQIPRRFLDNGIPLNLSRLLIRGNCGGYYCPFCSTFCTFSLSCAEIHMKTAHEDPAVLSNGEYYIPCYTCCRPGVRRKVKTAHYHCRCGVIFHSVKAVTNHIQFKVCEKLVKPRIAVEPSSSSSGNTFSQTSDRPQRKAKLEAMAIVDKVSRGKTIEFGSPLSVESPSKRRRLPSKKVAEIDLSQVNSAELANLLSTGKSVNDALLEIFERIQVQQQQTESTNNDNGSVSEQTYDDCMIPVQTNLQNVTPAPPQTSASTSHLNSFSSPEIEAGEISADYFDSADDLESSDWTSLPKRTPRFKSCNHCSIKFARDSDLRLHRSSVHRIERCRFCAQEFNSSTELVEHVQCKHPTSKYVLPVNLICTLCGVKLDMVEDLAFHYREDHNLSDCNVVCTSFNNATLFYAWKSHMEVESHSYFVKRRRNWSENDLTVFFACSYSWGDNRVSLKIKKTERHCPAFIKASQARGSPTTNVTYCLYHVGHELPMERFWKQIQKSLHGLLSFRHKAKNETRRVENDILGKLYDTNAVWLDGAQNDMPTTLHSDLLESSSTGLIASTSSTLKPTIPPYDLDDAISFYWETMREKFVDSGNYSLSIDSRWSNRTDLHNGALVIDQDDRLCKVCQVEFKNRKSMMRHMLRIHHPKRTTKTSKYSRPVRCLFCNMEMAPPGMKNLIQHYINAHDQQIQLKMRLFLRTDEFNSWREAVTGNVFKRHKYYQSTKGDSRQYWTCKFSGKLQNPPAGVTDGHCPAWIFAQTTGENTVQVSYCLYHIGHDLNPDGTCEPLPSRRTSTNTYPLKTDQEEECSNTLIDQLSVVPNLDSLVTAVSDNEPRTFAVLFANDVIQLSDGGTYQIVDSSQLSNPNLLSSIEPSRIVVSPQPALSISLSDVEEVDDDEDQCDSGVAMETTIDHSIGGRTAVSLITDNNSSAAPPALSCDSNVVGDLSVSMNQTFDVASSNAEETTLRHQITVLVRSTNGDVKFVKVALTDFPLVTKDGRKYYALDEVSLVEAVSQVMIRQGEALYEGDQLELLQ